MRTRLRSIASRPVWKIPDDCVQVVADRAVGGLRQQNISEPNSMPIVLASLSPITTLFGARAVR